MVCVRSKWAVSVPKLKWVPSQLDIILITVCVTRETTFTQYFPVRHNRSLRTFSLRSGTKMSALSRLPNSFRVPLGWAGIFVASSSSSSPPRLHLSLGLWFKIHLSDSRLLRVEEIAKDLPGGHESGKLQWGKLRELSLPGVCASGFQEGERGNRLVSDP